MADPVAKERGVRKKRKGVVVRRSGDKTVAVKIERRRRHPRYGKVITEWTTFAAHDEKNETQVGDIVRIVESRPMSRTKRWRVTEILQRGEKHQEQGTE